MKLACVFLTTFYPCLYGTLLNVRHLPLTSEFMSSLLWLSFVFFWESVHLKIQQNSILSVVINYTVVVENIISFHASFFIKNVFIFIKYMK